MDFPDKHYNIIYADPPWRYRQKGGPRGKRGVAAAHYDTMTTEEICALPVQKLCGGGYAVCLLWATFPNIEDALRVMRAWGFEYRTAAFVWVKKNRKSGSNFWGMGAYTRANAEVCLLGVTPGTRAGTAVRDHGVHQIVEAPFLEHSRKPAEVRERIVRLLGDVPRIELFARERVPGWDAWGNEV
nr:MT-A70 family methyltransferase [uncultured Oscillibacter sp.]